MKSIIVLTSILVTASVGSVPQWVRKLPLPPTTKTDTRITNGNVAEPAQFPYQVGLSLVFSSYNAWCGGTLISDRWIVTAAHCTKGAKGVTVYLGATDINNPNEKGQQRIYCSMENIIVHGRWNPLITFNDISLIKLPVSVVFNEYIQPASLPKKSDSYATYVGKQVLASGWGKDSDIATTITSNLQYIESSVISKRDCNIRYVGTIVDEQICISGKDGRSPCNGDSGGPLVYKEGDVNYLIGATSFGASMGCESGWPAVFTRITSYLDWIEEKSGVVNK